MKSRWVLTALAVAVAGAAMVEGCQGRSGRMGSLVWPPDTIRAVYAGGNTYEVTTVPPVIDPKMKVVLVWPPDTTIWMLPHSYPAEILLVWPPDTT
jgi:hypothetical protein